MGPYAGVDYNSPYLIVNSGVTIHNHYKGKCVEWGSSLLLVENIVSDLSANFQNNH
jgi:hypothetical protein